MSKLLKSGEFAEQCGVTKKALVYYEEIGLIKPYRVEENGYRFYKRRQQVTIARIQALKAAGMSLDEIRTSFESHNLDDSIQLVRRQSELIAKKIDELQLSRSILEAASAELKKFRIVGENKLFPEYIDSVGLTAHEYSPAFSEFYNTPVSGAFYQKGYVKGDKPKYIFRQSLSADAPNLKLEAGEYMSAYFSKFLVGEAVEAFVELIGGDCSAKEMWFFDVSHDLFTFGESGFLYKISTPCFSE